MGLVRLRETGMNTHFIHGAQTSFGNNSDAQLRSFLLRTLGNRRFQSKPPPPDPGKNPVLLSQSLELFRTSRLANSGLYPGASLRCPPFIKRPMIDFASREMTWPRREWIERYLVCNALGAAQQSGRIEKLCQRISPQPEPGACRKCRRETNKTLGASRNGDVHS